jgi:hypothetical protein
MKIHIHWASFWSEADNRMVSNFVIDVLKETGIEAEQISVTKQSPRQ